MFYVYKEGEGDCSVFAVYIEDRMLFSSLVQVYELKNFSPAPVCACNVELSFYCT